MDFKVPHWLVFWQIKCNSLVRVGHCTPVSEGVEELSSSPFLQGIFSWRDLFSSSSLHIFPFFFFSQALRKTPCVIFRREGRWMCPVISLIAVGGLGILCSLLSDLLAIQSELQMDTRKNSVLICLLMTTPQKGDYLQIRSLYCEGRALSPSNPGFIWRLSKE